MPNQQLIEYIKQARAAGKSDAEIKSALLDAGWQENDIEQGFSATQVATIISGSSQPESTLLRLVHWFLWLRKKYIILLALIIVLVSAHFFLARDIAPIDDSDLRLENVPLPPENQNAYYDLIKIGANTDEPKDILDYLSGKKWDDDIVQATLEKNEPALSLFTIASKKGRFQDLLFVDPNKISHDMEFTPMSGWRTISRLSALKALYLERQGKDDEEAINEALKSARVGQKILNSQNSVIGYLVGMAIKSIGLNTTQKIIISSRLSSFELSRYTNDIDQFNQNEDGLKIVFKGEHLMFSKSLDLIFDSKGNYNDNIDKFLYLRNSYYFKRNKTKAISAESTRSIIRNIDKPCNFIEKYDIKMPSTIKLYFTENAVGKILGNVAAGVSFDSILYKKCDGDLLVSTTQLTAALKAYWLENGNYPASLEALVPKYISKVLEDPFDGKPIRYSSEKKIIWSVGKDGVDSGGSAGDDWREMPDPTLSVDFYINATNATSTPAI